MSSLSDQINQLKSAIAAQEALRPTLGDAVVDVTLQALQAQLEALYAQDRAEGSQVAAPTQEELLTRLASFLPKELAAKMRATGHIESERKQVTVMFADLSGFTALSERMDAEEVTTLANEALRELAQAVYEYEGYIDKFTGDAIMAVFGAPISHEDDPERALRAALRMREKMEPLSRQWHERLGEPLSIHIGVSTGPVVAGNVSPDNRLSYTVMGDTVNTASRLEDASQAGQILVSRDTYRLTEEAFAFNPLPPLTVKGKRQPLVVYELERAHLHPEKARGLKDLAPAFVGREREFEELRKVQSDLAGGRGRVVALSGEAGIGKSRLMAEWRNEIGGRALWLEGRCFAHTASLAYGPFLDLIRRYIGIQDEDSEAEARARLDAAVNSFIHGGMEASALFANLLALHLTPEEANWIAGFQPEALRQRMFGIVSDLLARMTQMQPLLLVIEDMHWIDRTSLDLIERLLPLTGQLPLALVFVFRPDPGEPTEQLLNLIHKNYTDRFTHLSLTPLSENGSVAMVEQLLMVKELPAPVRDLILSRTEGNPFFVEEVIRSLIDSGALRHSANGEGWTATSLIESITVPNTLQGLLAARLDHLPDVTKWTAQQAAVIGRIFLYRVLLHIAENTPGLDANLNELEREELIRERTRHPEIEYIFKHALTQEVAYSTLLAPRRKELHRKAGTALEFIFADRLTEFRSIIAEHFWRAEAWDRAVEYLISAGDDSARLYANAEARLHYGRALEAIANLSDTKENRQRRVDVTVKLVSVSWTAEDPVRNLQRLAEAEELARRWTDMEGTTVADRLRLARVHYWMGRIHYVRGATREAIAYYRQVLGVAQEYHDEELLTIPSAVIGQALTVQGRFNQAAPLLASAIPLLDKQGNVTEWIRCTGFLGVSLTARGQYAEGLDQARRALARAEQVKNPTAIALSQIYLAFIHLLGGSPKRTLEAAEKILEVAAHSGDRLLVYLGYGFQAWAHSRLGNTATAMASMKQSKSAGQALGGRLLLAEWFTAADAEIALRDGHAQEAQRLAEYAVTFARGSANVFGEGIAQRIWAQALANLSPATRDEVDNHFALSVENLTAGECKVELARTHAAWGEVMQTRQQFRAARDYFDQARAQFEASGLDSEALAMRQVIADLIEEKSQ